MSQVKQQVADNKLATLATMSPQQVQSFITCTITLPEGSDTFKLHALASNSRYRINFYGKRISPVTGNRVQYMVASQLWIVFEKSDGSLGLFQWQDSDLRTEQQLIADAKSLLTPTK